MARRKKGDLVMVKISKTKLTNFYALDEDLDVLKEHGTLWIILEYAPDYKEYLAKSVATGFTYWWYYRQFEPKRKTKEQTDERTDT